MAKDTFMYVRIRPHNARRGHLIRRYLDSITGVLFDVENGWYKVSTEHADRLAQVRQRTHDPDALTAFEVISGDTKIKRDTKVEEEATKEKVIDATAPPRAGRGDLTIADVPKLDDKPKELGITWRTSIDDMREVAGALGIDTDNMDKKALFSAIKAEAAQQQVA